MIRAQNAALRVLRGSSQIAFKDSVEDGAPMLTIDNNCTLLGDNCYYDWDCCSNYCNDTFGSCDIRPCRMFGQSCGPNEEFDCCLGLYCDGTSCKEPVEEQ